MRILDIQKLKDAKCPFNSESEYNKGWDAILSLIIENPDAFMIDNGPSKEERLLRIYTKAWEDLKNFCRGIKEFDGAIAAESVLKVMDRYLSQEAEAEEEAWKTEKN